MYGVVDLDCHFYWAPHDEACVEAGSKNGGEKVEKTFGEGQHN